MARKPRPDPMSQGCIADIYKWFIGPLVLRYKPPHHSIKDWMNELFDLAERDVVRFVVKRDFTMPGLFTVGARKTQGIGYRQVKEGDVLWVRRDNRHPNEVDVEWVGNVDQVFTITASEWSWMQLHVEEQERKRKT